MPKGKSLTALVTLIPIEEARVLERSEESFSNPRLSSVVQYSKWVTDGSLLYTTAPSHGEPSSISKYRNDEEEVEADEEQEMGLHPELGGGAEMEEMGKERGLEGAKWCKDVTFGCELGRREVEGWAGAGRVSLVEKTAAMAGEVHRLRL